MFISRGRVLASIALLQIAAWVVSGQNWYEVSMSPNDESVVLLSFDAFSVNTFTSPILLALIAATAATFLTRGTSRLIVLLVGAVLSVGLSALALLNIAEKNLSSVSKQLETATGIAATHGLADVVTTVLPLAFVGVASYTALALGFAWAAWVCRFWAEKSQKSGRKVRAKAPTDAISLWDQQR